MFLLAEVEVIHVFLLKHLIRALFLNPDRPHTSVIFTAPATAATIRGMAQPKLRFRTVFVHDLLTEWARQEPELAKEAALIRQLFYEGVITGMRVTVAEHVNADGLTLAEAKQLAATKKELKRQHKAKAAGA